MTVSHQTTQPTSRASGRTSRNDRSTPRGFGGFAWEKTALRWVDRDVGRGCSVGFGDVLREGSTWVSAVSIADLLFVGEKEVASLGFGDVWRLQMNCS